MDKKDEKIKEEKEPKKAESAKEIEELKEKIDELKNQNMRLLADYRNLEKRVENQRREWMLGANKRLLLNLLPVLDTLVFANNQSQGKDQSLNLSLKQFLDILEKEGVKKIKTKGANFDPNLMQGVEVVEGEDGKVIEEVRAGFTLYDKVIRPAEVKVGSKGKDQKEKN